MGAAAQEEHVRAFVRSCVRSGMLDEQALYDEVVLAITAELPQRAVDAAGLASAWIAGFRAELARDEREWPEVTDYDLLQAAFTELESVDVEVLQGCEDHWAAKARLEARAADGLPLRGIAWFTPPDIWHAIDEGMLEVNLWHRTTANVAPGEALLEDVISVFERHGLAAHFDEGRIEVSSYWQRPSPQP